MAAYDRCLFEAGATGWEDIHKIGYLEAGLNMDIQKAMLGVPPFTDYGAFKEKILQVDLQLQRLNNLSKGYAAGHSGIRSPVAASTDAMDWTASISAMSSGQKKEAIALLRGGRKRRPETVGDENWLRRRKGKTCHKCEGPDHFESDGLCGKPIPRKPVRVAAAQPIDDANSDAGASENEEPLT